MLQNKTALITGGSRGIGRAIALAMAKEGADIAVNYAGNKTAAEQARELIKKEKVRCEIYRCDVSNFEASGEMAEAVIKDFGRVDILVNNAGITRDKLILNMTEADFDSVININLKGAFNMIKHLVPNFIRNRTGSIINITSVTGLMGNAGQANYAAAKAGLVGLTKSIAKELAGRGVTCNAIAPGFIDTDMTAELSGEIKQKYLSMIPMKRAGNISDIASLAIFLASAEYITGEIIKVDGGLYI